MLQLWQVTSSCYYNQCSGLPSILLTFANGRHAMDCNISSCYVFEFSWYKFVHACLFFFTLIVLSTLELLDRDYRNCHLLLLLLKPIKLGFVFTWPVYQRPHCSCDMEEPENCIFNSKYIVLSNLLNELKRSCMWPQLFQKWIN